MFRSVLSRALSSGLLSARMTPQVAVVQRCNYADMALTFASPAETFYNNSVVKQVDVPSLSGHFGILAEHVPTLAVLKPGTLVVTENDGSMKKYFGKYRS